MIIDYFTPGKNKPSVYLGQSKVWPISPELPLLWWTVYLLSSDFQQLVDSLKLWESEVLSEEKEKQLKQAARAASENEMGMMSRGHVPQEWVIKHLWISKAGKKDMCKFCLFIASF